MMRKIRKLSLRRALRRITLFFNQYREALTQTKGLTSPFLPGLLIFAGLIANRAGSLASRLTRSSAFPAVNFVCIPLKIRFNHGVDMLFQSKSLLYLLFEYM